MAKLLAVYNAYRAVVALSLLALGLIDLIYRPMRRPLSRTDESNSRLD